MNRTVKDATTKAFHYETAEDRRAHVQAFLSADTFAKHLKALRWRTPFQAICDAWKANSASFRINPHRLIPGPNTPNLADDGGHVLGEAARALGGVRRPGRSRRRQVRRVAQLRTLALARGERGDKEEHAARHEARDEADVAQEAVELGNQHGAAQAPGGGQRRRKLGPAVEGASDPLPLSTSVNSSAT